MTKSMLALSLGALLASGLAGCKETRDRGEEPAPTYAELAPQLERACLECHGAEKPAAGYALDSYHALLGCTADGRVPTQQGEDAPLLSVLTRPDHQGLLSAEARDQLRAFVLAGAPHVDGVMHEPGMLNPRSPAWHGKLAATDHFAPLRDAEHELWCGRCHAGAPLREAKGLPGADGAPDCTSCHTQPDSVFACTTCHGSAGHAHPPRDLCYFAGNARDPHAAHVTSSRLRAEPLECATCHQVPKADELFAGSHADGKLDIVFAPELAGSAAQFNAKGKLCSVACHARGGAQAEPSWHAGQPLNCQSCHQSPPRDHYPGSCKTCHSGMGESAEQLLSNTLHINGKVDLGDGRGSCGSCHGHDDTGAPDDVAHRRHLGTLLTLPIACSTCHEAPSSLSALATGTHMNGRIDVRFSGRAQGTGPAPSFDAAARSCSSVACHGESSSAATPQPRWDDFPDAAGGCQSCHAAPPPPPHAQLPSCGGGLCHGAEVAPAQGGFSITESGRALHIDGVLQVGTK